MYVLSFYEFYLFVGLMCFMALNKAEERSGREEVGMKEG